METFDLQKTRQIWQRVYNAEAPSLDAETLIPLISQEGADAACCARLAKRLGGHGSTLLHLVRQYESNAGALRGIYAFLTGKTPTVAFPPPREEPPYTALKKCYVNSLSRSRHYEGLADHPDYGPVFRKLASAARDQCVPLLELIGKLT